MNNFAQTYAGAQCSKEQAEKLAWSNQQTAQGGIGGGSVSANSLAPSPPQTLLSETCERIGLRVGQLHQVADRLRVVGDRVFGVGPEAVNGTGGDSPKCEAARLEYLLDCLNHACLRLEDQISRIEQI